MTNAPPSKAEYDRKNTVQVKLKLNKRTDAAILRRLEQQPNKQGYIKALIKNDIVKENSMKEYKREIIDAIIAEAEDSKIVSLREVAANLGHDHLPRLVVEEIRNAVKKELPGYRAVIMENTPHDSLFQSLCFVEDDVEFEDENKMRGYEIYEDNAGSLFFCIIGGESCTAVYQNWELGEPGELAEAIRSLREDQDAHEWWGGLVDLDDIRESNPEIETFDDLKRDISAGSELVAWSSGDNDYTDVPRMGIAAKRLLGIEE